MRRRLWLGLCACAGTISACGDASTLPTTTVAEFASTYESAWCSWLVRCELVRDEATCHELYARDWGLVVDSVEAQRITYDGELAGACLGHVETMDCSRRDLSAMTFGIPLDDAACAGMLAGLVEEGGECLSPLDCADGAACAYPCDNRVECCLGACQPALPKEQLGAACVSSTDCVDGAYCAADGKCTMKVNEQGATCDDYAACAWPLICHMPDPKSNVGTCYRPGHEGQACDPAVLYGACALYSNICDSTSRTCVRAPLPGEPCDSECLYEFELDCRGTCVPEAAAGDPCSQSIPSSCAGNLRCDSTSATCVAPTGCDPS